jgi:hypothetical protein
MVQAFLSDAPQESFADRIGSWSVIRGLENLNCTGGRHASKTGSKFAIVIPNQVLGCLPIGSSVSELLRHPDIGRRARHAYMDHLPRLEEGVEERKEWSKEEIGDQKARRTPRPVRHGCAERSPTSGLVAGEYE